ncbi:hypothetical protein, partial [Puniceibacterium antarcticum]|uniref:hypothetical protein n=1 Tax=Puniceibacterium antarcticum TaxID=1206336 RepID=UPI001C558A4E
CFWKVHRSDRAKVKRNGNPKICDRTDVRAPALDACNLEQFSGLPLSQIVPKRNRRTAAL